MIQTRVRAAPSALFFFPPRTPSLRRPCHSCQTGLQDQVGALAGEGPAPALCLHAAIALCL